MHAAVGLAHRQPLTEYWIHRSHTAIQRHRSLGQATPEYPIFLLVLLAFSIILRHCDQNSCSLCRYISRITAATQLYLELAISGTVLLFLSLPGSIQGGIL